MGRRLPALCGGGSRVAARVRTRKRVQRAATYSSSSSPAATKLAAAAALPASGGAGNKASKGSPGGGGGGGCYVNGDGALMVEVGGGGVARKKKKDGGGRRVMVLADGRGEAAGALQWALSQAVRSNDTVVLLTVVKPVLPKDAISDSCVKMLGTKSQRQLDALKALCESARPEVKVETCAVEAEERAPAVVEAARRHGASLLVLGQRRRRAVARWLQALWRRRRRCGAGTMVEYCIENAPCVALAVRRRSSGGYLVSSKRHKDFWLLA